MSLHFNVEESFLNHSPVMVKFCSRGFEGIAASSSCLLMSFCKVVSNQVYINNVILLLKFEVLSVPFLCSLQTCQHGGKGTRSVLSVPFLCSLQTVPLCHKLIINCPKESSCCVVGWRCMRYRYINILCY